jgi:hypothetical protein
MLKINPYSVLSRQYLMALRKRNRLSTKKNFKKGDVFVDRY